MIIIEAKLKLKKHSWNHYENGNFDYSSSHVDYSFVETSDGLNMLVSILSKEYSEVICPIFIDILDFLYLASGKMPEIIYYKENGFEKNDFSCRFFTSKQFCFDNDLIDITISTLNENNLDNIKNIIKNKPFNIFSAFTSLTSKAYENIYAEHKITMLLHCFEGYIYNKNSKYKNKRFKDRVKEIVNILFEYENKYNTEILRTFNITEDRYLTQLTNTRHQFSHYISQQDTLVGGKEYIQNFVILHYIFRIYLLREINLMPKEKNIEEFLKSLYDWINVSNNDKFKDFKSVAYSIKNIPKRFIG